MILNSIVKNIEKTNGLQYCAFAQLCSLYKNKNNIYDIDSPLMLCECESCIFCEYLDEEFENENNFEATCQDFWYLGIQ